MTTATGVYGGMAADVRQANRRRRLLDESFDLLGTEGWQGTSVRAICRRAELNPRYFYESFEHLDDLLLAVFDEAAAELARSTIVAYDRAPPDAHAKAEASIGAFVRHATEDPRRARVLLVEALGNEALAKRRLAAMHAWAGLLASYAREFYGEPGDTDPISEVTGALLVGGVTELLIAWLDGRLSIDLDDLIADVAELFVITGEGAVGIARGRARTNGR
ncbi:MAG: TetR/AcrR family transcriptional regulator [Thermoleophilaceae bacterium]|nr:TetR/AcrR family transcriptional regulator [Thermoleophilaceae bacterium]